jgi:6-phosphofructokinase 1
MMKRIGIYCSGGDAPGMNAAIRGVVRTALYHHIEVYGIRYGYNGMIDNDIFKMDAHMVSGIIHRGGTILKSSRSDRFLTEPGRRTAAINLKAHQIDGLVALGGDGTFKGALALKEQSSIPIIGIPATIDGDLFGTDYTIGYDTAINTVIDAVDKIRDTADALDRLFFIEVMGRDAGLIALRTGIATGAEAILVPETKTDIHALAALLRRGWKREKSSKIIIVAEGDEAGGAFQIAAQVKKEFDRYDTRVTVLGHIQRGGNPTCMDRYNASELGFAAVNALMTGRKWEMSGMVNGSVSFTPFEKAVKYKGLLDQSVLDMIHILSS